MKALTLIPKKVKKTYDIERTKTGLNIHQPVYVNVNFDERFRIEEDKVSIEIINERCWITLYKSLSKPHITIF